MSRMETSALLAENVARIRDQMAQAAAQAGREPHDVQLCAVAKRHPGEVIRLSAPLQIDLFGENRMQEMVSHMQADAYAGKPCHFIGRLQSNKVRRVVGAVRVIESVGTARLLGAINKEAARQGIVQDVREASPEEIAALFSNEEGCGCGSGGCGCSGDEVEEHHHHHNHAGGCGGCGC